MSDDIGVDPQVLAETARALREVPEELAGISGFPAASAMASSGMGLSELADVEVGHEGLSSALSEFGDAWDFGTRHLVGDARSVAEQLETAGREYERMDSAAADELRKILPGGE